MNLKSLIKKITTMVFRGTVVEEKTASNSHSWQTVSGSRVSSEILRQSVDMANAAFPSDYSVSLSDVKRWLAKDPSSVLLILDQNNQVAAYFSGFQISAQTYTDICEGDLCDWDITEEASRADHYRQLFVDKNLYFYIGAIVVRENLRGSLVFKLLIDSIVGQLQTRANHGQLIYVACEIHSPAAKHTAIKMGLQPHKVAPDGYPIYSGLLPSPRRPHESP